MGLKAITIDLFHFCNVRVYSFILIMNLRQIKRLLHAINPAKSWSSLPGKKALMKKYVKLIVIVKNGTKQSKKNLCNISFAV